MAKPLITVVIPTAGRPQYLPQAVNSALNGMGENVEVIVVPNGPDDCWKDSLGQFSSDHRVRVEPIITAQANAARNHGLILARGKYIRFLDDDDFIYPGATRDQCLLLDETCADICSGAIELVTDQERKFGERNPPETSDFVESILAPGRLAHTTPHVYRRALIADFRWDETVSVGQDMRWMHVLCIQRDWKWVKLKQPVVAWRHHTGSRTSRTKSRAQRGIVQAEMLLDVSLNLIQQHRFTPNRRDAASKTLWRLISGHYFFKPIYWDGILRRAQELFPGTYPDLIFYKTPLGRRIPPRLILVSTIPLQIVKHEVNRLRANLGFLPADVVT